MTYKFKQKSPLSHESFYDTAVLAVISIIKPDNFYFVPIHNLIINCFRKYWMTNTYPGIVLKLYYKML